MIGFPRCDHLNQEDVFSDQLRPKRDRSTSRQRPKPGFAVRMGSLGRITVAGISVGQLCPMGLFGKV